MDGIEALELRPVNGHVQRFLGGFHMEIPTSPSKTRFRNLKRLVLCDMSFDATALAEFVEIQRRGTDSLGAYGHYIKIVFQGKCEGRKFVFQQQRPQELAQQTPDTNCPDFEGGGRHSKQIPCMAIVRNIFSGFFVPTHMLSITTLFPIHWHDRPEKTFAFHLASRSRRAT